MGDNVPVPLLGKEYVRYALIEVGQLSQNLILQPEALGLGAGIVRAFHDADVLKTMRAPSKHKPLLIMPVGYRPRSFFLWRTVILK